MTTVNERNHSKIKLANEYHDGDFDFLEMKDVLQSKLEMNNLKYKNKKEHSEHIEKAESAWENYHQRNHKGYKEGGSYKLRKYLLHACPSLSNMMKQVVLCLYKVLKLN